MKTNYLFPASFKKIGWSLFVPSFLWGIYYMVSGKYAMIGGSKALALWDGISQTNFLTITHNDSWTEELLVILLTVSMLFIGFSREKDEDECIASIRMNALTWAILINSALLIVGSMLIFGLPYLTFMSVYMFSLLLLFITKYTWDIYKFRKN